MIQEHLRGAAAAHPGARTLCFRGPVHCIGVLLQKALLIPLALS
jgi:hypothetical protein